MSKHNILSWSFRLFIVSIIAFLAWKNFSNTFEISAPKSEQVDFFPRKALAQKLASFTQEGQDTPEALELAETLYRQDKRNEIARIIVALRTANEGHYEEFFDIYSPVFRTDGKNRSVYLDAIVSFCQNPAFKQSLFSQIEMHQPEWGAVVLEKAYQRNFVTKEELFKHYIYYPDAHKQLIGSFIGKGDLDSAYRTFLQISDLNGYDVSKIPFNPEFKKLSILPPFNWQLNDTLAFIEADGIDISYYGRERPVILSQTFPLSTNNYALEINYTGSINPEAGYFLSKLRCVKENTEIFTHTLKAELEGKLNQFEFSLPEGSCRFVRLTVSGEPGLFPGETNLKLHKLTIKELN